MLLVTGQVYAAGDCITARFVALQVDSEITLLCRRQDGMEACFPDHDDRTCSHILRVLCWWV